MQDNDLLQLFNDDIGTAQRLLELIDAEFQAMGERDLPRLEQLLGEKLPLLSLLEQHGTARSQLLVAQQLSADRAGLQALASRSPHAFRAEKRPARISITCAASNSMVRTWASPVLLMCPERSTSPD